MKFYISDILSITTGKLLSRDGIGGVYKILNYMTRDNLFTHQLPRAMRECHPWLIRQHSWLDSPEMKDAVVELDRALAAATSVSRAETVVAEWIFSMGEKHGAMLEVEPIPMDDHDVIDPIEELKAMAPDAKIVVI